MTADDREIQNQLKRCLQVAPSGVLERLAAALIGNMLGLTVAVAKAGFQHGGDAGPAGRQGRRFRIETKRYADDNPLSERELLGEIDHALRRDPQLECWILVATRKVSEQLEESLHGKANSIGVPVVVIDWKSERISLLAALCSSAPDLVDGVVSSEAGTLARSLLPASSDTVESLRRDLQSWGMGFESLRSKSHEFHQGIWSTPRTALARLGQNAAVGASEERILRRPAHDALDSWLTYSGTSLKPAAVIGFEGVGKTWVVVDWLQGRLNDLPIILVIPASAVSQGRGGSRQAVKVLLAERLHELTNVRNVDHWLHRLERLLDSPEGEGPVLTVFFDGLNQQSSAPWIDIIRTLQDEPFAGRVNMIISTRKHHFEEKLGWLRGVNDRPTVVAVEIYDDSPGGEFDRMLAFKGLKRSDLPDDLIPLARTPRLFNLVVDFRDGLVGVGQVTPHRVLWEYGKHTLPDQAGGSFSENDWRAWLQEIARNHLAGIVEYTSGDLGRMSDRGDLIESEVYTRLSEIIDGQFATPGAAGQFQIKSEIICHALGLALLSRLETVKSLERASLFAVVDSWLDPISGLDERAEILRAAVSIAVEMGRSDRRETCGILLTSWLQTQNLPERHREEVLRLCREVMQALFVVIEESSSHAHVSARLLAIDALRQIPRDDMGAGGEIIDVCRRWLLQISRDVRKEMNESDSLDASRSKRWRGLVGEDRSGSFEILGVTVQLVDKPADLDVEIIPCLLEGFPLAGAVSVFEAAALQLALRGSCDCWEGLRWLCLLNALDARNANAKIREQAAAVAARVPEPGIDSRLGARTASLMLRLSGENSDDQAAERMEPGIDRHLTYERDYLNDPGKSFFSLEWRHANQVLLDDSLTLWARLQRTKEFWLDPTFVPPPEFGEELRDFVAAFEVDKLSASRCQSREDIDLNEFEPALARCTPDLLASLIRKKLVDFGGRPPESRYWSAIQAADHSILVDDECVNALTRLREAGRESTEGEELYARSQLLMLELVGRPSAEQITRIIEEDLKNILGEWAEILEPVSSEDGEKLVNHYGNGTEKQKIDLVLLLSESEYSPGGRVWDWLTHCAMNSSFPMRQVACDLLVRSDAARFGHYLQAMNWSWMPDADYRADHYRSLAFIAGSLGTPFEQVASRIVPWLLPKALTTRCGGPSEALLAAEIFGPALMADALEVPNLGSKGRIDQCERTSNPFSFSIEVAPHEGTENAQLTAWAAMADPDKQLENHNRAVKLAIERFQQAKQAGANFYLTGFAPQDLKALVACDPPQLNSWLDGMNDGSASFRRRVGMAEGAYIALCEALLDLFPERGAALWRALRKALNTRFVGIGKVDELIHIPFRAPRSASTDAILTELVDLKYANTDKLLMDLVIAARSNDRQDWVEEIIAGDIQSGLTWRARRGVVLRGFLVDGMPPKEEIWPEGGFRTALEEVLRRSAKNQWSESCARHWWMEYLSATDVVAAYSAWVLFLRTADRRVLIWLRSLEMRIESNFPLAAAKIRHHGLNTYRLKRAMEKREEKTDQLFLGRKPFEGIGPWRESS